MPIRQRRTRTSTATCVGSSPSRGNDHDKTCDSDAGERASGRLTFLAAGFLALVAVDEATFLAAGFLAAVCEGDDEGEMVST